jgi:hypothetical protein
LPRGPKRLYRHLCGRLDDDIIDRALGAIGTDVRLPFRGSAKGKQRAFGASDQLKDPLGRLAYALTPKQTWWHDFPFYVGALHYVVRCHGAIGFTYASEAAFFLRQPMTNLARLRLLFTIGWAPPEAMVSMRPLIAFCQAHHMVGSALPAIFDSLSTTPDPQGQALQMLQTIEALGSALGQLRPLTREIWLFVASGLPTPYTDLSWLRFAAKAILFTLSEQEQQEGPASGAYLMGLTGLMQVLLFLPEQRLLTMRLFAPLHGQQIPYATVSEILTTLAQPQEPLRMTALVILNSHRRQTPSAAELCRRARLANLAAQAAWMLHTSEPP